MAWNAELVGRLKDMNAFKLHFRGINNKTK